MTRAHEMNDVLHKLPQAQMAVQQNVPHLGKAITACPKPTRKHGVKCRHVYLHFQCKKCGHIKNTRKFLEYLVEEQVRSLVFWRDGYQCVERDIDGGRCRGVPQWGHFIARHSSPWLRYSLATFVQCEGHNYLEYHGDKVMEEWFVREFGIDSLTNLRAVQAAHVGQEPSIDDLRCMLNHYKDLNCNCPALHDKATLIELGYYGPEIMEGWERQLETEATS